MTRLALVLLVTGACVADEGDQGFEIRHALAPPDDCVYTPGGAFISRGSIDKAGLEPYVLHPEFVSRITISDSSTESQRTIAIRGARVDVQDAATGSSYGKFTTRFAASLSPLGSTAAGFEAITSSILASIPATTSQRTLVIAKVTAFGALGGSGDEIDAVPFEYPITVCDGCQVQVLGPCPLPAGSMPISETNACHPTQDGGFIQCCSSGGAVVCPAVVSP